jgi:pimeloyl-ACP methyl ester carboxylesterase
LDSVCESGRVLFFELAMPWLDRAKAARMDFGMVAGPALVIAGGCDRIVPGCLARRNAARYRDATYVEILGVLPHGFLRGPAIHHHAPQRRLDRQE